MAGAREEDLWRHRGGDNSRMRRRQFNKTREHKYCKRLDTGGDESKGELHEVRRLADTGNQTKPQLSKER